MSFCYFELKRYDKALVQSKKAVDLAPDNPRFAYVLGIALNSMGETGEAVTVLRDAHAREVTEDYVEMIGDLIAAVASKRLQIPLVVSVPGSDAQVAGKNPLFRRMARFTFAQAGLLK